MKRVFRFLFFCVVGFYLIGWIYLIGYNHGGEDAHKLYRMNQELLRNGGTENEP